MKRVVIVGGGFAGACIAKSLEKDFIVTLVDTKNYFEFTPGVPRCIVQPRHLASIEVLHTHYLHRAEIIRYQAKAVTKDRVISGDREIKYDYLAITTGSRYNTPFKEQNLIHTTRGETLRNCYQRLIDSRHVVIIGGGIVGVELAGEILESFPKKKVTIAHSGQCLMERCSSKAQKYAQSVLFKMGAEITFNDRVTDIKEGVYVTKSGKEIIADMGFLCTGIVPNSELMKESFGDKLTERAGIKVNEHMQVEGLSNVFAAGDVTSIMEEKTAQNAEEHAKIIIQNIRNMEKGKELVKYEPKPRVMIISIGKKKGMLLYKGYVMTGLIPALLKAAVEIKTMMKYKF